MNYIITNKKNCIKLDGNGRPVTCSKDLAQEFEYSKAKNILSSLPRSMKRFMFQLEAVPEILAHKDEVADVTVESESGVEPKTISTHSELSASLNELINRMEELKSFKDGIPVRRKELLGMRSAIEKKILNIEHEIEFAKNLNACEGYKKFKELKNALEERREIKDEILILEIIPGKQIDDISEHVIRSIEGLKNRTYTYR